MINYHKKRQQLIQKYVTMDGMDIEMASRRAVQEVRRLAARERLREAKAEQETADTQKKENPDNASKIINTPEKRKGSSNTKGTSD